MGCSGVLNMKYGSLESNNEIVRTEKAYVFAKNAFYPVEMKDLYLNAGSWPDDGVEVSEDVFNEFSGTPPDGKVRVEGENGMPEWADIPPRTTEELEADAESKKSSLISYATQVIAPLKDALDGGYIEDEDKPKLTSWQKYRYALTRVNTSNPEWPEKPE